MGAEPETVDRWLEEFVAAESEPAQVEAWVDRTATSILAESPEVASDAVLSDLLRTAVKAHWTSFLAELGEPAREVRLVSPAVEFAAELARRRLHLATLFKVYRIAQQSTWRYLTEVVRGLAGPVDDTEVLVFAWSRASGWIDASVTASVDVYQTERDKIVQGATAQLLDQVRAALDGEATDLRELSARLGGYPISGCHTGLVLRVTDDHAAADLEAVGRRLAAALGSRQPLLVRPGGQEVWCWAATREPPDLRVLLEHADDLAAHAVSAYVGSSGEGLDGFGTSHAEAQAAARIALRSGGESALVLFPEVELLVLLDQSAPAARRFTERILGELAVPTAAAGRLRETLRVLLSSDSVEEAARRLSVHKNTVRYRVGQAEEILGRSVHGSSVELALALRYHATFLSSPSDM